MGSEMCIRDSLISEVKLGEEQYGGIKGIGTNHFLLMMWQHLLEGLEEDQSAVSLMSIDFSKAFNRMCHQSCLIAQKEKGCSSQSLRLIYTFLKDRNMSVRCGNMYSKPRKVNGGSPQGTKLGNFLFCITLEDINVMGEGEVVELPEEITLEEAAEAWGLGEDEEEISAIPEEYNREIVSTPGTCTLINENFYSNSAGTKNKLNVIRLSLIHI